MTSFELGYLVKTPSLHPSDRHSLIYSGREFPHEFGGEDSNQSVVLLVPTDQR